MIKRIKSKVKFYRRSYVENVLPRYCYRSGLLASLYYTLFSPAFRREHQAVLAGKVEHNREEGMFYLLVRNTHRLEKGLLMRPRRDSFGRDYIEKTIQAYSTLRHTDLCTLHPGQFKWFTDVLSQYFQVVLLDKQLRKLKERFEKISETISVTEMIKVPYNRRMEESSNISYDEFYKLTKQRRSVRWFEDRQVSRELVDKAIMAANQSPSACNRQPFEFIIIDDPELLNIAVDIPMGTAGYSHSIPMLVVVVGNLNAYFSERDRHLIYIDASLANMSFMLALETLGLSSCPINWPDIESREAIMSKFLKLKDFQRPVMCIGVGYPDRTGMVAYSEKRQLDELRKYNL